LHSHINIYLISGSVWGRRASLYNSRAIQKLYLMKNLTL
jgi:hypothetical protein